MVRDEIDQKRESSLFDGADDDADGMVAGRSLSEERPRHGVSFSLPSRRDDVGDEEDRGEGGEELLRASGYFRNLSLEMEGMGGRRRSSLMAGSAFSSSLRDLRTNLLDGIDEEEKGREVDDDDDEDEEAGGGGRQDDGDEIGSLNSEEEGLIHLAAGGGGGRTRLGLSRTPSNYRMSFVPTASPSEMSSTFWDDVTNFTPGSVPHSTGVAIVVGSACGLVAYVYYALLEFLMDKLWRELPRWIFSQGNFGIDESLQWLYIPSLGLLMALGVGLSVRLLGEPGDLAYTVRCVHDDAFVGMDHVLPMLVASQFSILGCGSLGPEAPLVAICAAVAGYISRRAFGQDRMNLVRKHTLMGMASALAAFFGVPLGGSIFALEINNRFGIEYYEHLVEAIFAGTVCVCVFRALAGLDIGPLWSISPTALPPSDPATVLLGAAIGMMGAAVACAFASFHKFLMGLFARCNLLDNEFAIRRALAGSSAVLTIAVLIPHTAFWGELEFETIATASPASDLPHIFPTGGLLGFEMDSFWTALLVGLAKMVAISFTVAGGYRGGFIFPLFAAGGAFGRALVFVVPSLVSPTIATLCFAAGINVSITRTALATTLILVVLSGELNAGPPVLAASMISLFATSYMPFIRTQAKRTDISRKSFALARGEDVVS